MPHFDRPATIVLALLGDTCHAPYHVGAYEGLVQDPTLTPNWLCGSSAGSIAAAIIAGNSPERRQRALREYLELCMRAPLASAPSQLSPLIRGVRGQFGFASRNEQRRFTAAREMLLRLVDFDLINEGSVRLTMVATNAASGRWRIFDNRHARISPEHVLASSLASPENIGVSIDGQLYWNDEHLPFTALDGLLDSEPGDHIAFVVDPWSRVARSPVSLNEKRSRAKEITSATRVVKNIDSVANQFSLKAAARDNSFKPLSAATAEPSRLDIIHAVVARDVQCAPEPDSAIRESQRTRDMVSLATREAPWDRPRETSAAVHKIIGGGISTKTFPDEPIRGSPVAIHPSRTDEVRSGTSANASDDLTSILGADPAYRKAFKDLIGAPRRSAREPSPPQRQSLNFTLEGEQARQSEAVWGSQFDLAVSYGLAGEGDLGGVLSKEIDRLIARPSMKLGITIVPKGLLLADGIATREARFENGTLTGEAPRFKLAAPSRSEPLDAEAEPSGIHIVLSVAGALIHTFFLEIHLVDALGSTAYAPVVIDFDLQAIAAAKLEERIAELVITSKGDSWQVYWNVDGVRGEPEVTSVVTPSKLKAAYDSLIVDDIRKIANNALWKSIDEELTLPSDDISRDLAREAMQAAVTVGSKLYRLFSEDPVFQKMFQQIEALPLGAKIAVITDSVVLPWEMLYPLDYIDGYPAENYQPEQFWGNRFVIESLLIVTSTEEKLPTNRQQARPLHVTMGLNEGIDLEKAWEGRKLLPVKLQKDYFDLKLAHRGNYASGFNQVMTAFRDQSANASLIYFFCHGTADILEFEKSKPFTAFHVSGPPFENWPLVFVNACDAGNISPVSFLSFRKEFRKRRSAGLVAPSFPIPTLFAAVLARTFIERYAERIPVGKILFDLRRELLARDNPLGLWYSLQCPLDLKAPT
ncbi:hypothetical protein [Bradyrhizobium sp. McL0616]|uniref:hypothetical protein n=1 Tax=Bradyrhizobium sp. McL0616 TaxID=3415674 RepID=UPI003CE9D398